MIKRSEMQKIVSEYANPRIGVLGSHSALEIMDGAKDEDLETIVFCQKGRETPYQRFNRIADQVKIVNKFKDMASPTNQKLLRDTNTLIVPHRSLTAYLGYEILENKLKVPIFGNRRLFQAEERENKKNQYYLLKKAGIKYPKIFETPKSINRPAIVKVMEKNRSLERAFFTVTSYADYKAKSEEKIKSGIIARKDLEKSSIEELKDSGIVIWTTTPWTIPGNRAIAYGENIEYAVINVDEISEGAVSQVGDRLVVCIELMDSFKSECGIEKISEITRFRGRELSGTSCAHPLRGKDFDYDVDLFQGSFVTTETGTGFVHMAPSHGEDDYYLCLDKSKKPSLEFRTLFLQEMIKNGVFMHFFKKHPIIYLISYDQYYF